MTRQLKFSSNQMVFLCSALLLLTPCVALGQITNVTDDQSAPAPGTGHDYFKMLSETVNPANGSVSLRIGVPVPESRGITIPFSFAYDSNGVHHFIPVANQPGWLVWTSNNTFISQGGWSYSVPLVSQMYQTRTVPNPPYPPWNCNFYNDYTFQDPKGGRHALYLSNVLSTNPPSCTQLDLLSFSSANEDYFYATISNTSTVPPGVTLQDADGTVYNFSFAHGHSSIPYSGANGYSALPDTIEDRNGNIVSFKDSGNGAFTVTDTAGRSAIVSSGFGTSGNTVTVSGLSNPYTIDWQTINLTGYNPGAKLLTTGDPNCLTAFPSLSGSETVISSITLPNGESYQFSYDTTTGLLQKITYPTGGYVRYVWAIQADWENAAFSDTQGGANACLYEYGVPVVSDRYVSFDGNPSHEVLQQQFQYSVTWSGVTGDWTAKSTTVTTTDSSRGANSTTTYNYSPYGVGYPPNDFGYFASLVPVESSITYNDWSTNGSGLLRTVTKEWWDQYLLGCEQTTLGPSGPSSMALYYYTPRYLFSQMSEKDEYDFGTACPAMPLPVPAPTASLLRQTKITYATIGTTGIADRPASVVTYDGSGNRDAETDYSYDGSALTTPTPAVIEHDTSYNSCYTTRGNATSMSKWVSTSGGSLTWNYTYDITGQELSRSDPKSNSTTYSFTDAFGACASPGPPGNTNAYLTTIADAKGFTQTFNYRYCDGELNSATDRNNQTTSYSYADSLSRLTQISYPDTGQTTYTYSNACGQPATTTILLSGSTNYTESATLDGVCHVTESAVTSDPQGTDYTDTTYDGTGRVWTVSNPYRSTSDPTYGLTTTVYDALGRTLSVAYADGSTATTSYSGKSSTVTDAEGNARTLVSDALGRLQSVAEDPSGLGYSTSYAYNPLDKLTTVTQSSQTRTFAYDSLARLTSATNPESGTTSYTYPTTSGTGICSGDPRLPCTRTDARNITTTYTYDALNRRTAKGYSDGITPIARFSYDEAFVTLGSWTSPTLNYPKGRLTHTTTMSGSTLLTATVQDYDPMGRTKDYWQCTPLNCGNSSIWAAVYNYDQAGDVTSWNHPAGFTITQTFDGARDIEEVTSSWSDGMHPATLASGACLPSSSSICYTPWGAVSSLLNGCVGTGCTQVQETYFYNKRLQVGVGEIGTAANHSADACRVYNYYVGVNNASACSETPSNWPSGTNNNGNAAGYYYLDNANSGLGHAATYHYDHVNRLTTAAATGNSTYSQSLTYDAYGNLDCSASPAENACLAPTYPASNQIYGYRYDAAGDVTNDGTYTYTWDAEAHLTKVVNGGGTTISTNTYNALGQRVRDVTTGATTDEAYGGDGSLLWGWTGNASTIRSFVPFKGGILAEYYSGGTLFDHSDELGSVTTSTSYNGSASQERLFYPFGELWTGAGSSGMHQTFAKLPDYDAETNQYNTLNRHYTPSGRWMSPDPGGLKVVKLDDPQTWNMYAYVRNNPTTLTDPTGLFDCGAGVGDCQVISGVLVELKNAANSVELNSKPKAPQPPQRTPDGKLKPPPVRVPGAPDLEWKWNPDPQNPRGGTWGPKGWKGPNPPSGSWDPAGHWDINRGKGEPVDHYDPDGNWIPPELAHPRNFSNDVWDAAKKYGPVAVGAGVAAGVIRTIIETAPLWLPVLVP